MFVFFIHLWNFRKISIFLASASSFNVKNDNFHTVFSLSWLQILNLPALPQNKNTRIGPFPWKWSVLQNPDRERTNQSTGICLGLGLPYNNPSYSRDCSPHCDFSGQLTWHKYGPIIWMVVRGLSTINNKIFDHKQDPCNHTLADNLLHYHYYHKNYSYLLIITIMIIYYNIYHCSFFPNRLPDTRICCVWGSRAISNHHWWTLFFLSTLPLLHDPHQRKTEGEGCREQIAHLQSTQGPVVLTKNYIDQMWYSTLVCGRGGGAHLV